MKATGVKDPGKAALDGEGASQETDQTLTELDPTSMGESMSVTGQSINLTSPARKLELFFPSEGQVA